MKLKLHATGKDLKIIEAERLISGSRKIYSCEFTFDDSWDGYTVTAVFSTNSSRLVNMAIVDGVCEIPSEVLRPNARIRIGIFGIDGERSRPTTYSDWVTVEQGTDTSGGAAQPPTPSIYEQWTSALDAKHEEWNANEQARQEAEAARVEAEQAREDLETGYVARAESAAETAEAAAKVAEDAKDVIEDVMEGNFATKSYVDQQIAAIPTPDVSGQIGEHNTSKTAHADIREGLENHTHSYLPLSGGTLSGNLMFSGSDPIIGNATGQSGKRIRIYSGTNGNYAGGAGINLYQADHASNAGVFTVSAHDGTNTAALTGTPDGKLTWKGGNVYHTGNKPTAADVGAASVDSVTRIQSEWWGNLSKAGWYRIAKYVGTADQIAGSPANSVDLTIKRNYSSAANEYHHLRLASVYSQQEIFSVTSKSRTRMFTKARYTHTSSGSGVAYLEVYYNANAANSVQFALLNGSSMSQKWEAISPEATSETVSGMTVGCTYDIPTNAKPLTTATLANGAQIQTGSYSGSGGYRENNAITLTFNSPPKLVFVTSDSTGKYSWFANPATLYSGSSGVSGSCSWSGNTLTWYSGTSADSHLNTSGKTFYWFAIF